MTPYEWFHVAETVILTVASFLSALVYWSSRTGRWAGVASGDIKAVKQDVEQLQHRMERAGAEVSSLASDVQALPQTLRTMFVATDVYQIEQRTIAREYEQLWQEIHRMQNRKHE